MPVTTEWNRRGSGEFVGVGLVDDEICEYLGIEAQAKRFSAEYNSLSLFAIGALLNDGGSVVEAENVERHLARCEIEGDDQAIYREFLIERYAVKAYRGA